MSIPASAEAPAVITAEWKLVNDLLLSVHSVSLDPLAEPMLILDLSQE